ncbi:hypothetical protein ACROYT_G030530 [Oculina patagonica]
MWFIAFFIIAAVFANPEENLGIENAKLFEGDMIFNSVQRLAAIKGLDVDKVKGNARGSILNKQWPGGVMIYSTDPQIASNAQMMKILTEAMNQWTTQTCIRFQQRKQENGYAYFHIGQGNYAMKWSEEHDRMLCTEVLVLEPWKFPKQSKERGEVWGEVALRLNGTNYPKFKVSKRSVRERLTLLVNKYKEKMRTEEQGSEIECDDETELEKALSEIIEKEQAADLERKQNSNTLTKKNESDKASAEESRLKAMERLGQTKKRNADASSDQVTPPKSRKSTTEAVQILKEKYENEKEIRKEEMEIKKKEQENRAAE